MLTFLVIYAFVLVHLLYFGLTTELTSVLNCFRFCKRHSFIIKILTADHTMFYMPHTASRKISKITSLPVFQQVDEFESESDSDIDHGDDEELADAIMLQKHSTTRSGRQIRASVRLVIFIWHPVAWASCVAIGASVVPRRVSSACVHLSWPTTRPVTQLLWFVSGSRFACILSCLTVWAAICRYSFINPAPSLGANIWATLFLLL